MELTQTSKGSNNLLGGGRKGRHFVECKVRFMMIDISMISCSVKK
jgi:hypothetical protein